MRSKAAPYSLAIAGMAVAMAISSCASSSTGDSGTGSSPVATTAAALTTEQVKWAADYTGNKVGAADSSLPPVTFGYVNEEGGTLSFPEATVALDATIKFINTQLGGINGHPLQVHKCLVGAPTDVQKCGTQMANDSDVKSVVIPQLLLNNQVFYNDIGGKKPILDGQLIFPIDYTTPNVYSYGILSSAAQGGAVFAVKNLQAKRVVIIRTDNPAGLGYSQQLAGYVKKLGGETFDVPVPEPGTAPQYIAAIQAAGLKQGDVISLGLTVLGAVSTYDALKTLNLTDIPVMGSDVYAGSPMPAHLKQVGAKDTVFPQGWYAETQGYSALMPVPNSNGADVYVSMMKKYAPDAATIYGNAPLAYQEALEMAKFLTSAGGPDATADKIATEIKTFKGPAVMVAGPINCGGLPSQPNSCAFGIGYMQRKDGAWASVADGINGKFIDTLPYLLGQSN